jgi:uncharacterized protein YggE
VQVGDAMFSDVAAGLLRIWRVRMKVFRLLYTLVVLISPAIVSAQSVSGPVIMGARLDVSTRGSVVRVPDVANISAGVLTQSRDAASALRDNANKMARVIAALRAAGIAERDMSTSNISLSPQYQYNANQVPKITGYQANNTITIKFREIGKTGAVLDALAEQGANQINGPNMTLDKPEAALDEARVDAMKKARARADLYAGAAGLHVKRIISINESVEGDFSPRPMMVMAARSMAKDAATEVLPGEQTLSINLSVVFELQ